MNIKDLSIISPDIIDSLWINKQSTNNKLSRYIKEGKFVRVKRWYYINLNKKINIREVSNLFFKDSYISLDTILYKEGIIKQFSKSIYSISNTSKTESIDIWDYKLYNYKININSVLWIYIDNNWLRKATKERAILDSMYLKIFSSNYPGDSEMNINNLDSELINNLLPLYPERVQNYYLKQINE